MARQCACADHDELDASTPLIDLTYGRHPTQHKQAGIFGRRGVKSRTVIYRDVNVIGQTIARQKFATESETERDFCSCLFGPQRLYRIHARGFTRRQHTGGQTDKNSYRFGGNNVRHGQA
jgi:hypothetical protein